MRALHRLHPAWVNAALLGSVWASVEIVLGSFLHNLRVPLAGTLMAALGVALLVAGSRMWNMPGLIWRAGAICALMKSVSPSAIILGPMVGIFLEGLVLETSTRLLGRNAWGYIAGGALAASLPILQKIAGLLLLYGFDAARLYIALYETAARFLHIASLGALDLVLVLVALTLALGGAAAAIGIAAGGRAEHARPAGPTTAAQPAESPFAAPPAGQRFSLALLALHGLAIPAGLLAIARLPFGISAGLVAGYMALTLSRYGRVRSRLLRARVWIEFAIVSVLAGLLLGELTSEAAGWSWSGLGAGLEMTTRAALIMTAFSAVSVELRNPAVVGWFLRRGLDSYSAALGVAFEALPAMTQAIGRQSLFLFSPLESVARVLAEARMWLRRREGSRVLLVTGKQGSGKTTFVRQLADTLSRSGTPVSGIFSPTLRDAAGRAGYDVQEIGTDRRVPLCRRSDSHNGIRVGPFSFSPTGIAFGVESLDRAFAGETGLVIIDEVGPLELKGEGWAGILDRRLAERGYTVLITVRPQLLDRICDHWQVRPDALWTAGFADAADAARTIIGMISERGNRPLFTERELP